MFVNAAAAGSVRTVPTTRSPRDTAASASARPNPEPTPVIIQFTGLRNGSPFMTYSSPSSRDAGSTIAPESA